MQRFSGGRQLRAWFLAATGLAAALSLAACGVTITAASPAASAGGDTQAGPAPSSAETTGGAATGSATSTAGSTAAQWKTYTDPARTVSFDLPAAWTTQLVPGKPGKGIRVEVRGGSGDLMATLQTHLPAPGGTCPAAAKRPYTVLASIPLQIPSDNTGAAAVAPRFVYRVIQGGTHFYASYGITDQAGGADRKACLVHNTVQSNALGAYMFGDVRQFTSALDGSAGLRAFATIADAQAYMRTGGYLDIQRMVTSLKVLD
ncbi:hypothetical protein [Arthrobacter sp. SDTb3-6]|uniref:hypothetical protein n=1 Tax=Arthrobacter sp. SDTb3-6 TaxID=2713571 RepID=UPI00159D23D1|nr:hypothetical protein [Arthrobacter sp. SDTb3-6]NVM98602.1 hypothetical protein [Arthrobacter sp. SDTb3-6]